MRRTGGAAVEAHVSWAGDHLVPRWLDIAREYMERWVHQQHIREAVGRPGHDSARFAGPVIAASMFAVPPAMRGRAGGPVVITVEGAGGGDWSAVHDDQGWKLVPGRGRRACFAAPHWCQRLVADLDPGSVPGAGALASVGGGRS